MAKLSDFFKINPILSMVPKTGGVTTPMFSSRVQTLPNNGGLFQSPVVAQPTAPVVPAVSTPPAPMFSGAPAVTAPPVASAPIAPPNKYINPATGQYYTPQEYARNIAASLPIKKGSGDVSQYAGDAITKPNATDLPAQATNLNNARNDIAVGATDPYDITQGGTIVYSPQERKAIESAYAGVYDPALNDVFARLKDQKTKDDAAIVAKQRQADQISSTNENIRQWKATTGTGPTYSGNGGTQFTKSQMNDGASNAGMKIEDFTNLDDDMKNFFIQNPTEQDPVTGKNVPLYSTFTNLIKGATTGQITVKEATDEIMNSTLPDSVKAHFIDLLPLTDVEKQDFWSKFWRFMK